MNDHFRLPDEVRDNVLHIFGDSGREWLEALPGVASRLTARWRLTVTGSAYGGGSHALVVPVAGASGARAALKVPVKDDENRFEAEALRRYAGDGAVRLYESDPSSGALLLERAEPGTPLTAEPDRDAAIGTACALLSRLRRPAGPGQQLPLVRRVAASWSVDWPRVHDRHRCPFSSELVGESVSLARELATPDADEVMVNRDAHLGNVLAAEREPWLLIDPKPLVGEPAFDGGYLLLDLIDAESEPGAVAYLARRVSGGLGVSTRRVVAWALLRAVENAMCSLEDGDDPASNIAQAAALVPLL